MYDRTEARRYGNKDNQLDGVGGEEGDDALRDSFCEGNLECLAEEENTGNVNTGKSRESGADDYRNGVPGSMGVNPAHCLAGDKCADKIADKIAAGRSRKNGYAALSAGEDGKSQNAGKEKEAHRTGALDWSQKEPGQNRERILDYDVNGTDGN